jgi:predicted DNA binding CopG/RHH family protein
MDRYDTEYTDRDEKDLVEDIEKVDVDKLKSPSAREQKELKRAARRYLEKETKMNIRIDPNELQRIKFQAQREGLKYQTLIKSVLHKYITGQLVEKKR